MEVRQKKDDHEDYKHQPKPRERQESGTLEKYVSGPVRGTGATSGEGIKMAKQKRGKEARR